MSGRKKLLFIDDEIHSWYMRYYIDELEKRFDVKKCSTVDEAYSLLTSDEDYSIIIVDVIMPPGEWFQAKDTKDGLLTGKFLAEEVKKLKERAKVYFLSNLNDSRYSDMLKKIAPVFQKLDYSPIKLLAEILK